MLYRAEIWGIEAVGNSGRHTGRLLRESAVNTRNVTEGATESELGRGSGRRKIECAAIEYWSAEEELVRQCYDWQVGQRRVECWARRLV
jgi:hypothetical protein